jgi:DNA-binding NarL/FixJ family response regulator
MPTRGPIWVDHGNPVLRRGLIACLTAAGYPVVGVSNGLQAGPALARADVLLFEIRDAHIERAVALARRHDVRLVGLLGRRSPVRMRDLQRAGLSAVLGATELTPARLVACMQAVQEPRRGCEGRRMLVGGLPHDEHRLTAREIDVLRLLASGATTRDIAEGMSYSERTVKNIVHDILVKLRGRTRAQAVAVAARLGVI